MQTLFDVDQDGVEIWRHAAFNMHRHVSDRMKSCALAREIAFPSERHLLDTHPLYDLLDPS